MLTDLERFLILRELKFIIFEHLNCQDALDQISIYKDILLLINTLVQNAELEILVKGEKMSEQLVLYNGVKYILIFKYDSGFCEIREYEKDKIELVDIKDLVFMK